MSVTPKTYDQILTKGLQSSLASTPIQNGKLRYTTDTGRLYMDHSGSRIRISDFVYDYTEAQILALQSPLTEKLYISSDTGRPYIRINNDWYFLPSLTLTETSENTDKVIWLSNDDEGEPSYSDDFTYNPSTGDLKAPKVIVSDTITVGDVVISDTLDTESGYHTVNFSFASAS